MSLEAELTVPGNSEKSIFQIMEDCALQEDEEFELARFIREQGGVFLSTPFCREAVDLLMEIGVAAFKIGSGECNNYPFVDYVASKKLPIILSTGMNSVASILPAVEILRSRKIPFVLMHTTNLYPTPQKLIRLSALQELNQAFPDAILGLSDHSVSNAACIASIPLGARLLERHFTDSKSRVGPDIPCSMDGKDLAELLYLTKGAFDALGGSKLPADEEKVTMNFAFASVATLTDISKGDRFTMENIFPIRPSGGDFGPKDYQSILGLRANNFIKARTQLRASDVEKL
jgi:N-acetylneuraminate synthase